MLDKITACSVILHHFFVYVDFFSKPLKHQSQQTSSAFSSAEMFKKPL